MPAYETEPRFARAIQVALDQWFEVATVGPAYLYFKLYGEEFGVWGEHGPQETGWQLVTGEPMPRNTDRAGCYQWMRPKCGAVPFYRITG